MILSIFFATCLLLSIQTIFSFHAPTKAKYHSKKTIRMGNNASFGIFSPAVYAAKFILGEAKLNKLRGKAISLHSQAITEWCLQYGAYNLRLKLIKKAKKNGDRLGFLV